MTEDEGTVNHQSAVNVRRTGYPIAVERDLAKHRIDLRLSRTVLLHRICQVPHEFAEVRPCYPSPGMDGLQFRAAVANWSAEC